jgi:hypothetical protein
MSINDGWQQQRSKGSHSLLGCAWYWIGQHVQANGRKTDRDGAGAVTPLRDIHFRTFAILGVTMGKIGLPPCECDERGHIIGASGMCQWCHRMREDLVEGR